MLNGKGPWRNIPREDRRQAMLDALTLLQNAHVSLNLFGVAVDTNLYAFDGIADAFEHLATAFDRWLVRNHRNGQSQRGLMLFDKHKSEEAIQKLARDFKDIGHRWGVLRNMADVPVFLDSRASRLIQAADLVAFAMKRHYQNSDSQFFDVIKNRFYREGRQTVGLTHLPPTSALFTATSATMPNASSCRRIVHDSSATPGFTDFPELIEPQLPPSST